MDRAPALDCRIDPDIDLVVLRRGAQDARICRQVPLGQGRHDTAATRTGDAQANSIAAGKRVTNPSILDEVLFTKRGRYDDVWAEPRNLKTPLRIEFVEPVERGRRQQMHGGTVEERPRGESEVGDGVPEVEALHVWPVLLGIHCSRMATPGGIQFHGATQRL